MFSLQFTVQTHKLKIDACNHSKLLPGEKNTASQESLKESFGWNSPSCQPWASQWALQTVPSLELAKEFSQLWPAQQNTLQQFHTLMEEMAWCQQHEFWILIDIKLTVHAPQTVHLPWCTHEKNRTRLSHTWSRDNLFASYLTWSQSRSYRARAIRSLFLTILWFIHPHTTNKSHSEAQGFSSMQGTLHSTVALKRFPGDLAREESHVKLEINFTDK